MNLSPLDSIVPNFGGAPTLQEFGSIQNVQDGVRIGGSPGRQFVRFYKKREAEIIGLPRKGQSPSIRETEHEMVNIVTPGDTNVIDTRAEDYHRREYWQQYRAFRDGKAAPIGKQIDEVEWISPSIATELRYYGVHTLEQLADASDYLCDQVPNGWELRAYSQAVVKVDRENKSLGQVGALKAELEKSQEVIQAMQKELNEMRGLILNPEGQPVKIERPIEAEQPEIKKRGRPRKEA